MHIEFMCHECGARSKTFNQFASYVEGAETMGRATCALFGIICRAQNMDEPLPLSFTQDSRAAQIIPRVLGHLPSASLQDEGMVMTQGPPEEENTEEQHI